MENEIFYLYIPEGHHPTGAVGWSYISFIKKSDDETTEERKSGIVYDSDGAPAILESYCGKYIKLKYVIVEGKYNKSYRFTIVG